MIQKTSIIQEDISEIALLLKKSLFLLEGKNIVLTGASGMLGSYLVYVLDYANEHFFKEPAHLYIITRNRYRKFGTAEYTHYIHQDITKKLTLPPMHFVIHAASKAAPKLYTKNMIDTLNTNILGLYSLLELCDKNTKSFLYFSSAEIYGEAYNKPIPESFIGTIDHLNKRSCYVEAKKACETIAMNYYWEKNIPIKIARIFHTFGPGINLSDGRVFSDFIRFGLEKKDIVIQGNPALQRSMLYIKDATIMFLKILLSDHNGEVYNVGSEKNLVTIKEFADIVCSSFNKFYKKKIKVVIKKDGGNIYYKNAVQSIRPSLKKFKRDFDYYPKTSIEDAVKRTVAHFLEIKKH